jgi:energy-coupling factor transport system substrate-specific component
MDVWNWTFYQSSPSLGFHAGMPVATAVAHFARFYAVTSFVYDSFRAAGNAVMVFVLGAPVLAALARLRTRLHVSVDVADDVPDDEPADDAVVTVG